MEIKKAVESDAGRLARIVKTANIPVAQALGLNRDNAPNHPSFCTEDWILNGMERGEIYYYINVGDEAAGCVAYESPEPNLAYLNRLAVLPGYQRRGLGKALVAHVENLARSGGKRKISIGIIKSHTRLWRWYEGLGFREASTKQFAHLPFDVLFMHLNLETAS